MAAVHLLFFCCFIPSSLVVVRVDYDYEGRVAGDEKLILKELSDTRHGMRDEFLKKVPG